MSKHFFITATGTEVGKTYITTKLCQTLQKQGKSVNAVKPVITGFADAGFTGDGQNNDTVQILQSLGLSITAENIDKTSPWRLKQPVSPDIAARNEGRKINFSELVKFCQNQIKSQYDYVFIEGIGGVSVPLNDDKTILDLINELKIPVILVAANYLGTISHTLTAMAALKSCNIKVEVVLLNNPVKPDLPPEEIKSTLSNFINAEVVIIKHCTDNLNEVYNIIK